MALETTHAGSLPRPAELDQLFADRSRGKPIDADRLARLAAAGTDAVVARQLEVGIDIVNNGEVARESFFTYVHERLSGFSGQSNRQLMGDMRAFPDYLELRRGRGRGAVSLMRAPACEGPVAHATMVPLEDELALFERARAAAGPAAASAAGWFVTAASPGIVAAAMENRHYPSDLAYAHAVAQALAPEYRRITSGGYTLQIDAPDLAMERHTRFAERPLSEFLRFAETVVDGINQALEGVDPSAVRLHVCWGNYDGPHHLDVPLADILPVLAGARVGGLLVALANPRHAHEVRLLGELPPSWQVVVGAVETTTNYVEHPEVVADRLVRAAVALGDPARLVAGTDCGFATAAGYGEVAPEIAWAKLRSLVEGAALASERLGLTGASATA